MSTERKTLMPEKSKALIEWEKKRDDVLAALTDGHPNPEGYMEWWSSQNPQPTQ